MSRVMWTSINGFSSTLRMQFFCIAVLLLTGCATPNRYTSLDLELLPCEQGGPQTPQFFQPVEFDSTGRAVYPAQGAELLKRLSEREPAVSDLVIFVHGWNKNSLSAEQDYQNFICRLHGQLRKVIPKEKTDGRLIVVGIFWPSTITNQPSEPYLLKPLSYYRIRARADGIAEVGLANLFSRISIVIHDRNASSRPEERLFRIHLIGHSFGGRMIIQSLKKLRTEDKLIPFLKAASSTSVVLINSAAPATRFDWIAEAANEAKGNKSAGRFLENTSSYLFNIHSFNDTANRVLFPLASAFNEDAPACAAGACGVIDYATLCVDNSGKIPPREPLSAEDLSRRLNAWNVDASQIVFEHSDIYKGRMATLIADLLYDQQKRQGYPLEPPSRVPTESRCTSVAAP